MLLQRHLNKCRFKAGDRVKLKGTPRLGTVEKIIVKPEEIIWDKARPNYIVVKMDDGQQYTTNYTCLKGSKK